MPWWCRCRATENEVYGYIHMPCRVEVNARLREERAGAPVGE